jgi:hypothetical protein
MDFSKRQDPTTDALQTEAKHKIQRKIKFKTEEVLYRY